MSRELLKTSQIKLMPPLPSSCAQLPWMTFWKSVANVFNPRQTLEASWCAAVPPTAPTARQPSACVGLGVHRGCNMNCELRYIEKILAFGKFSNLHSTTEIISLIKPNDTKCDRADSGECSLFASSLISFAAAILPRPSRDRSNEKDRSPGPSSQPVTTGSCGWLPPQSGGLLHAATWRWTSVHPRKFEKF